MLTQAITRDTRGQFDYVPAPSTRKEVDAELLGSPWLDLSPVKVSFLRLWLMGFMVTDRLFAQVRAAGNETIPTEEQEPQLPTSIIMECSTLSSATEDVLEAVPLEEDILRAMTADDVSIPLPPKRSYAIDLQVRTVRKALPRVIEPS